jgi:hypothetical protein
MIDSEQCVDSGLVKAWQRLPILLRALLLGSLISSLGVFGWIFILVAIPSYWSLPVSACLLVVYLKYFSGSWKPRSWAELRKSSFRQTKLSSSLWIWGLVGAALLVIVSQSGLALTFRIIEFPAEQFKSEYKFNELPVLGA